jgi:PAS domain S-box-containing protein
MAKKLSYKELEQRVKELEREPLERERVEEALWESEEKYRVLFETAKNQAEEALRESEKFSSSLLDNSPNPIIVINPDSSVKYVNCALERLTGFSSVELIGKKAPYPWWTEETLQKTSADFDEAMREGTQKLEQLFQKKAGERFWVKITSTPVRSNGEFKYYLANWVDITELKQVEEALRDSQGKLDAMLQSIGDHMSMMDEELNIVWANKIAKKIFGNNIIGKKCYEVYHKRKEPCEPYPCITLKAFQDRKVHEHDTEVIGKDGKTIFFHCTANVALKDENGKSTTVIEISRDITELKQAEEALRETRDYLENLIDHANAPVIVWDRERRISLFNHASERLTGYAADKVIGQEVHMLFPEERRDQSISRIASALAGEYWESVEIPILCKDGDRRIVLWNSSNMYAEDGKTLLATIAQGIDITDRMRAAEEKKQLEVQLQQAQKMEAIGSLAGGIAHDFNNILYPIIGYADLTMDHVPEGGVVQKNLHEILKAANRAKDLVQQILTFSRQGEHEREFIKIQPIIKEVLRLLRSSIPTTIEISQNIDKECGVIQADPTQIYQVLMNLCTNAYHSMREKGGVLEVTLPGHGMDQAVIKRIFDPYFTTKPFGEGTGLGLAITHGIVKSYGGGIQVHSKPGEGTTFHVYLPLIEESSYAQQSISTEPIRKGNESILLVDDEDQIVRMVQETLKRLGYHVTPRTSSIEALEAFRAQPDKFDLVITDMTMPNMTGAELAPKLLDIRPDIPIILCTGI